MSDMFNPTTVTSKDYDDQISSFKKHADSIRGGPEYGKDWYGPEYEKHINAVRQRYPLLTSLLLRGKAEENANLSDIGSTNKYARMADAYNAQMRYAPTGGSIGGKPGEGTVTARQAGWSPVEKLETQDQQQMDQLRETQGDLRKHQLGEESHYQREYLTRKMGEMEKYMDQGMKQQFFGANETMRRVEELFDMWRVLETSEFNQRMEQLQIPEAKRAGLRRLLKEGNYIDFAIQMEGYNMTPMSMAALLEGELGSAIVKGVVNGTMGREEAYREFGRLKADQQIYLVKGMLDSAKNSGEPALVKVVDAIVAAAGTVAGAAETIAKNPGGVIAGVSLFELVKIAGSIFLQAKLGR
jgi:hypothetical protein